MKFIYLIILSSFFWIDCLSQEIYTARKGLRFFPGHIHAVITVDSSNVKYELFNHWYTGSYAQYRNLSVPINSLNEFNSKSDSIQIEIIDNKVRLVDEKYRMSKKVKHQKLCASTDYMRKISFAYELTKEYDDIRHFELYEQEELKLPEVEFNTLVTKRMNEKIK